jgi:hypothetical protein
MDKQILDRIKKSEQRVVDLYAKVRDLNTTVYGGGGTQGLKEQYTILQIDPDLEIGDGGNYIWPARARGKALKDLYQKLKDKDSFGGDYRHTILVPPGEYYFDDGEPLILDYQGIDLVSLTGEPDVFLSVRYNDDPFAINQLVGNYYEGIDLQNANLSFLNVGNNIGGQNFGLDSQGIFFNNVDQGEGTPSYPVRFPGIIYLENDSPLFYDIDFIHENSCSDLGFAIWENGIIPRWDWDSTNTLFKVQIDCGNTIEIYGRDGSQSSMSTGGLTVGVKYRLNIQIYPDNNVFVGLFLDNFGWIVYNNYSGDFVPLSGTPIEAGLAADSDGSEGGSTMMHITGLYFQEETTKFTPCLSIETSYVTVRGIAGKREFSNNWASWSELHQDYNHPIFVQDDKNNVLIENCIGGPFSFGADLEFDGNGQYNDTYTFKNCRAPQGYSFGYRVEDYEVIAIGCNSLNYYGEYSPRCFDVSDELDVTVINCRFGDYSFRGYEIDITVKDTEVGYRCFEADSYFDGNFENVTTGEDCFDNDDGSIYGIYRNCKVGNYCFNSYDSIYADFYNCYFRDASNLDESNATCHFCINDDDLGNGTITVGYASNNVNITD